MALPGDAMVEESSSWGATLERIGTDRLLVLLASFCALVFGTLTVLLELAGDRIGLPGFDPVSNASAVFTYAVALIFGAFLLLAFQKMRAAHVEGAVLGLAFSIVLLFFAGMAGTIAGILGLVGAVLGLVKNFKLSA
jgi:hypothetical protein